MPSVLIAGILLAPANTSLPVKAASVTTSAGQNWEVPGKLPRTAILSQDLIAIRNLTLNSCLTYNERDYGINLAWDSACQPNILIVYKSRGTTIRYGDPVAIWVKGGGYLHYHERKYGINLVWSSGPVYEWEIRGGKTGEPVRTLTNLALYNQVEQDLVVYCQREYGINLRWLKDC